MSNNIVMRKAHIQMYTKPKILIVTQPRFPLPAFLNDGASAIVIEETLACLPEDIKAWALSLVDNPVNSNSASPNRNHLVCRKSAIFRLFRKVLAIIRPGTHWDGITGRDRDYLVALYYDVLRNQPDILVVHSTKLAWVLRIKHLFPSRKIVAYLHHSETHLAQTAILRSALTELDAFIFVCNFAREAFQDCANSLGYVNIPTFTIHNGINHELFKPDRIKRYQFRAQQGISNEEIVILFCGRLIARKGVHKLLDALAILDTNLKKEVSVIIAGGTDYQSNDPSEYIESLKYQAQYALPNKVKFIGYIPHSEMASVFAASDILVFPSLELEGFPLSLLEAQSSGLPVIASAIGGTPEGIIIEKTGFLVNPPGDPFQIAHYISLLGRQRDTLQAMGHAAREHIMAEFSREFMAMQFCNVMNKLQETR